MERRNVDVLSECIIEIPPPARKTPLGRDTIICPCCRKVGSKSDMDDDGCGICDECLAP